MPSGRFDQPQLKAPRSAGLSRVGSSAVRINARLRTTGRANRPARKARGLLIDRCARSIDAPSSVHSFGRSGNVIIPPGIRILSPERIDRQGAVDLDDLTGADLRSLNADRSTVPKHPSARRITYVGISTKTIHKLHCA